jgi:hypothetical protein
MAASLALRTISGATGRFLAARGAAASSAMVGAKLSMHFMDCMAAWRAAATVS